MALAYLLDPNQQFVTRGGVPNVGGLIKVYLNGTDDPATTYSDIQGTENPFPVVLDSNGRAVVIADETKAYRVEVYGADGDLLWTSSPVVPRTYTQNDFTNADKAKLDGIEEGAQKNVKSDWNATSGDAEILNKPNLGDYAEKSELAEVAFTGDYDDLENRPTIPAPQVNADWAANAGVSKILNKPALAPVATSGSYNDLSDTPNIPPAQVNSDWNANAGVSEILNKPDIPGMAQTTADALCELKANIEAVEADIPPAQVQSDYAQADPNAVDFIRNKPDLSLKEDVANKAVDTVDPTSTTEYPSSKAMANYTDTAIATNSGKYISDNGSPFTDASDLPTDSSVSNNDYAVVLTGGIYYRYKATVIGGTVSWAMEYAINTNAFTPAQQAAIDSTVTAVKVGNYDAHLANTTIHVTQNDKNTWNAKQNAISDLGTIRSGAAAGSTAVQPSTLAEKAEVTAAALCELKENVQGVEEDIPDVTVYAKIADLAAVAFSGDYDDLTGTPDLSVFARSADLATVATTGSYGDLLDKPDLSVFALYSSLAAVATSGDYDDLINKPTIPTYTGTAPIVKVGDSFTNNGTSLTVTGTNAWAEGSGTTASGNRSHSEGYETTAKGSNSHAEGYSSKAYGLSSHAEGSGVAGQVDDELIGISSHAEGSGTATGGNSHAEGNNTTASNASAHSEGQETIASGDASHAQGRYSEASGQNSHAGGTGTRATGYSSTAIGKYNDDGTALFVVGDGTGVNARSDCFKVDSQGNTWVKYYATFKKILDIIPVQTNDLQLNTTITSTDITNGYALKKLLDFPRMSTVSTISFNANFPSFSLVRGSTSVQFNTRISSVEVYLLDEYGATKGSALKIISPAELSNRNNQVICCGIPFSGNAKSLGIKIILDSGIEENDVLNTSLYMVQFT